MQWPVSRWRLAEQFHWPLEYIDSLKYDDLLVHYGITDADQRMAQQKRNRKRS